MTKLTLMIYDFLTKVQLFFWEFPNSMLHGNTDWELMVALGTLAMSLIVLFAALKKNGGSHTFFVKQMVAGIFVFIVTHITVLKRAGLDVQQCAPWYRPLILAGVLGGVICFAVVNFLLDVEFGKVLLLLYCSEFLFATASLKLWSYAYPVINGGYDYKVLMITMRILKPFTSAVEKSGFAAWLGVLEFGVLMCLMFVSGYFLLIASRYAPDEWSFAVISRVFMALSYFIAEIWKNTTWRVDHAFFVFVMSCGGMLFYLFWFWYTVYKKDQSGCIGVFFIGAAGTLCDAAIIYGVDMSRRGAIGKSMKMHSSVMTWLYKGMPIGRHTDFSRSGLYKLLGTLIAVGITIGIIYILFYIWEKVVDIDNRNVSIGKTWLRNSAKLLIIPMVLYWVNQLWGNIFGDYSGKLDIVFQTLMGLGMALCVSNMAGAFRGGFVEQLKRVLVSSVISLWIICLFVPLIMAMI